VAVLRSGLVQLNGGGFCLILRARGASFALRDDEEQAALVEAFGRFLNSLADPVEIVIRSEPIELAPLLDRLREQATVLPGAALRKAAEGHLRFLGELAVREGVRRREILLVLTTHLRDRTTAGDALHRRAEEASGILRAAGVDLTPLDGDQAVALLARALDPPGAPIGTSLTGVIHAC
jgi:hypothetical protein